MKFVRCGSPQDILNHKDLEPPRMAAALAAYAAGNAGWTARPHSRTRLAEMRFLALRMYGDPFTAATGIPIDATLCWSFIPSSRQSCTILSRYYAAIILTGGLCRILSSNRS